MEPTLNLPVTIENAIVLCGESNLTANEARKLDTQIDEHLAQGDRALFEYLQGGHLLAQMKITKAYLELGFTTWEGYLATKKRFKRTYWSYLLKVGQAGDPQRFIEMGMPPGVLIEYARLVGRPDKLHDLVNETWQYVEGLQPVEAGEKIMRYLEVHGDRFKKPKAKPRKRKPRPAHEPQAEMSLAESPSRSNPACIMTDIDDPADAAQTGDWQPYFYQLWERVPENERGWFLGGMREFLDGLEE